MEESPSENRDFRKVPMESSLSNSPVKLLALKGLPVNTSVEKPGRPCPGLQMPLDLCWPYADGDFFKDKPEPATTLLSTVENITGETLTWDLKYRHGIMEEILTDESDLSENEKANDTLLSYFKKMDLNLKPEKIETVEGAFTEGASEAFPYPDFLPPPFNTLDLHKLALSKSDSWKGSVDPLESSMDPLIMRLLEMERLQHSTVQKERSRLQTAVSAPVVTESFPSKAVSKSRQPKASDTLNLQITCVDKSREKRKNNPGAGKFEQNTIKWNWNGPGKHKWNGRPSSLKSSFTSKQWQANGDDPKPPKNSNLPPPHQDISAKGSSAASTQSLVKMVPARCLPPRSPIPISPIPLTFPEHPKEELKATRTKKKLHRKSIALNRFLYIQKLNGLSQMSGFSQLSGLKDKCSPIIDQK